MCDPRTVPLGSPADVEPCVPLLPLGSEDLPSFVAAQIAGNDSWIVHELRGRTRQADLAVLEDVAIVSSLKCRPSILLNQQDRHANLTQRRNNAEDLAHDQRGQPEAWFIEQEQSGSA